MKIEKLNYSYMPFTHEHMNVLPIEKDWVKLLLDQLNKGQSHWLIYRERDVAVFVSIIKKKKKTYSLNQRINNFELWCWKRLLRVP